jgi:hypothetical protein
MSSDTPYLTEKDVAGIKSDGSTKSLSLYPTISALRVCLLGLEPGEHAAKIIGEIKPAKATRRAWIPQTIADQIWVLYEFASEADRLEWEATLPPRVAKWLDRKVIPWGLEFGWQTRDANGWPC